MKKLTIEEKISEENLNVYSISLSNISNIDNNDYIGVIILVFDASGEECIQKFSLNTEQETTFNLFTDLNNANQRIVYCGGEGGTGKSQIINAIADYFVMVIMLLMLLFIMMLKMKMMMIIMDDGDGYYVDIDVYEVEDGDYGYYDEDEDDYYGL
jgi:hypothetical protein